MSNSKRQHKNGRRQEFWDAVKRELTENSRTFAVYSTLRIMVIVMLILQVLDKDFESVFICLLTLMLMVVPSILQVTFKVEFPSTLEIIILFFIFAAEILGEISAFYIYIPYWDTILHTLNGFICAALGMSLIEILNRDQRIPFQMSPFYLAVTSFCFSMTIGVLWEFFEFGMDRIFLLDMQKDTVIQSISTTYLDPTKQNLRVMYGGIQDTVINGQSLGIAGYLDIGLIDTMEDLFVNFIGAFVFSVLQYIYGIHGDKKIFRNLVPFLANTDKYNEKNEENLEEAAPQTMEEY